MENKGILFLDRMFGVGKFFKTKRGKHLPVFLPTAATSATASAAATAATATAAG